MFLITLFKSSFLVCLLAVTTTVESTILVRINESVTNWLGVPSIIIYPTITHYTKHLEEDYGLMYNYVLNEENIDKAINKGIELLADKETSKKWKKKRDIMLAQKIDVTQMLVWFIENYPESKKIMQENPDYQMRFK